MFQQFATSAIDPQQVFHIRDCDLDLEDLHITLEEGTIAFLHDQIDGRPSGALFIGEGSVLVIPPNQVERASLARFTKTSVLNEKIHSAFLRFYGESPYRALKNAVRGPEEGSAEFVRKYDPLVHTLTPVDALRLTILGLNAQPARFLHARVGGDRLGAFDAVFDESASEAVLVAQAGRSLGGGDFEDVWLSFPSKSQRARDQQKSGSAGEFSNTDQLQADQNGIVAQLAIPRYALDVQVAPPTDITARAELLTHVPDRPVTAVLFQLSHRLKVSAVQLDGKVVEFLQNPSVPGSQLSRSGNDVMAVVFPAALAPGSTHTLTFTYSGAVMTDIGGGLLYVGDRGTWYPNFGFRNALFDLHFSVPADWSLVSTGKQVSESHGLHFVTEKPVPVAGFNVGHFAEAQSAAHSGSLLISAFAAGHAGGEKPVPPDEIVRRSSETISFLESHIAPFPYNHLVISEVPGGISQGWPGLIFLSSQAFSAPKLGAQPNSDFANLVFRDLMLPHEIGHQFWGDNVSWRSYREQWIMEALANYCSLMLLQTKDPDETATILGHYRAALMLPSAPDAPVTLGQRLDSSQAPHGYVLLTYGRGTWLIHMLRCMMRDAELLHGSPANADAAFWSALRDLQARFAGKAMSERDLQEAFEKAMPASLRAQMPDGLGWFFTDWVNGASIPRYSLSEVRLQGAIATGEVVTSDTPKDFTSVLPLFAEDATGKRTLVAQVLADEAEEAFKVKVPAGTVKIVLDPEHEVLRKD